MFSNAASPASDTLPEELSKLGIAIPDQALQRIIEAVTLAITPRVSSSVERQIEARVRAEITAEVTANVTAEVSERVAAEVSKRVTAEVRERVTTEVTSSVTAEVSAKLQASFDARVKAAVQEQLLALYEEIRLQRHRMFGRRTETSAAQLGLFNEAEVLAQGATAADDQVVLPPASEKSTPKAQGQQARGKRKPLPAELPRVDVLHELPEDQRLCACGTPMVVIGQEVSEQLDIVPMQVRVLRHIRIRYGCPDKAQLPALAPRPLKVLPKSNASAGLLAMLITVKYVDGLPLARFEHVMARSGVSLPRQTQARWIIEVSQALQPLVNLARDHLLACPVIHMDETRMQVLKEPDRAASALSYMWVHIGGPPGKRVVLFDYETSRSAEVPERLLAGYKGYLMTDGYPGYNQVGSDKHITHLACWAHARRGFVEAKQATPGKASKADEVLRLIAKLYRVEKDHKNATEQVRLHARQTESKALLEAIRQWLDTNLPIVVPSLKLGQAIAYMDKHWPRLVRYIERGDLPIDNNPVENAIRPFVIGRKAWLFADTPRGAKASALLYSLVETAKACGVEPYCWLAYVLKRLPLAETADAYDQLMPWNIKPEDLITDIGR